MLGCPANCCRPTNPPPAPQACNPNWPSQSPPQPPWLVLEAPPENQKPSEPLRPLPTFPKAPNSQSAAKSAAPNPAGSLTCSELPSSQLVAKPLARSPPAAPNTCQPRTRPYAKQLALGEGPRAALGTCNCPNSPERAVIPVLTCRARVAAHLRASRTLRSPASTRALCTSGPAPHAPQPQPPAARVPPFQMQAPGSPQFPPAPPPG